MKRCDEGDGLDRRCLMAGMRVVRIRGDCFVEGTVVAVVGKVDGAVVGADAGTPRRAIVWDGASVEGAAVVRISWVDEPGRRTFDAGKEFEVLR